MYALKDYLYNGALCLNNLARPGHKKLSTLMLYTTTRCQSRCQHCSIWKKPAQHLSLPDIQHIMASRCVTPHTTVGLEGGEFVLHPQAEAIMQWFSRHHPRYTLLSNGLAPERVTSLTRKYRPQRLYLSLDGDRDTYRRMRGVDGHGRVMQVLGALRGEVPISLMFCLSPWNDFSDMEYVVRLAREQGVDVRIGIYGTMDFFDTTAELLSTDRQDFVGRIPACIHDTEENFDFVALYDEWKRGHLHLRCQSILSSLVVHSNGDVPLCQNLDVRLGNIHERSLDEIFNSRQSIETQCRHSRGCNGCWINFHRKYDIILLRNLERLLPKRAIEAVYGPYQWTADRNETYRHYLNRTILSNEHYHRVD